VPDEEAADDVPVDLSFLASQLDQTILLRAASTSERDSKFYDAPSGVVCVVKNADDAAVNPGQVTGVYIKTSNAGTAVWSTVWQPSSGLVLTPINLADPFTTRGTPTYDPAVIAEPDGLFASMIGAAVRVDGSTMANGTVVGFLPTGFLPYEQTSDYPVSTSYVVANGGASRIVLNQDSTITYFGPNVGFVSFTGIRYLRAQS
jgi:hypothetical protein